MATGELLVENVDLEISGRGFPFRFSRTYRSKIIFNGVLGHNWDFSYNKRLILPEASEGDILLSNGFARVDRYMQNADGSFESPAGAYDELFANGDGTFMIRRRDGFKTHFDTVGRMVRREDRNGNEMEFRYDDLDRVVTVVDTLGRLIQFEYNAPGRLKTIRDFSGREVKFGYDALGDLRWVRTPVVTGTSNGNDFPEGKFTRYTYRTGCDTPVLNHNLLSIIDRKGQRYLFNSYGENPKAYEYDRVVRQQSGDLDQVYFFAYSPWKTPDGAEGNRTVKKDRKGNQSVFFHNGRGNLLEERIKTNRDVNLDDPEEFVTRNEFNRDGERIRTVYPEGNEVVYEFDGQNSDRLQQGNLLAMTYLPGPRGASQMQRRISTAYEPIYNQVASVTEERGSDADYVSQNGGLASADRYTRRNVFDYQEGQNLTGLATEMRRSEAAVGALLQASGLSLDLGDSNGDGLTDQVQGNRVMLQKPSIQLAEGSEQATLDGDLNQEIETRFVHNRFGQLTTMIDPEGNVDEFVYHPENDPDGNGQASVSEKVLANESGGYLWASIIDSLAHPDRRSTVEPAQIRVERYYDDVGNMVRRIDGRGNDTLYEVNALNQVVRSQQEEPYRYERVFEYDENDNVVRDSRQNADTNGPGLGDFVSTSYRYDILDNLIEQREEVSTDEILVTRFLYDRNENLVRVIQPAGNIVDRVYDERDLLYSSTRGAGSLGASTTTMTYDGNRKLIQLRDGEDHTGDGNPEVSQFVYDGYDRLVEVRDALGNVERYDYDPTVGNVIHLTREGPDGGVSPTDAIGAGNVLLKEESFRFDELNRLIESNAALFANLTEVGTDGPLTPEDGLVTTRYEYDRNSRQTRIIDDNAHMLRMRYDGVDRLLGVEDHLNNQAQFEYDRNHNRVKVTETDLGVGDPVITETFETTYEYDSLDRMVASVDNLGNRQTYAYDSRNNIISRADRMGNITTRVFDGIDRLLEEDFELRLGGVGAGGLDLSNGSNSDGLISRRYDWDANSRLASVTDDNGRETHYFYDSLNRMIRERFADQTERRSTYDRDHNIVRVVDQNGSRIESRFDGLNRLVERRFQRASQLRGTTLWRIEYDGLSRLTLAFDNNNPSEEDDDSVVRLMYDSLSRVLVEEQNDQRVISKFDGVGNRLHCVYPDGLEITSSFDELNRIQRITRGDEAALVSEYDYLGASRILRRQFGNDTLLSYQDEAGEVAGYDGLRRMTGRVHLGADGSVIDGFSYVYDRESNRRFESNERTSMASVYEYDSRYRLVREALDVAGQSVAAVLNNTTVNADVAAVSGLSERRFPLDGVGNWVDGANLDDSAGGGIPDVMNQYGEFAGSPWVHDGNGNRESDEAGRYVYDTANRLVEVLDREGNSIATYRYDALGRRVSKETNVESLRFLYEGSRVIEEQDEGGTPLRQFIYGHGVDDVLAMVADDETFYYHDNSIGSVAALTNSGGDVVERYIYDAYGKTVILDADGVTELERSVVGNPYRFTGRRFDEESGLYFYRARYLDPGTGRFLQRDPKGYVDGLNLYEYVGSNPVNYIDPFGRQEKGAGPTGTDDQDPSGTVEDALRGHGVDTTVIDKVVEVSEEVLKTAEDVAVDIVTAGLKTAYDVGDAIGTGLNEIYELSKEYEDRPGLDNLMEKRKKANEIIVDTFLNVGASIIPGKIAEKTGLPKKIGNAVTERIGKLPGKLAEKAVDNRIQNSIKSGANRVSKETSRGVKEAESSSLLQSIKRPWAKSD